MPQMHGHMPLGQDGIVASVNGSTIMMNEEADEGGAAYTVDASSATVQANGAAGTLSDIKVGQKIFVQGTVNGVSVTATSISVGHPAGGRGGFGGHRPNDNDADDGATSTTQSSTSNQ